MHDLVDLIDLNERCKFLYSATLCASEGFARLSVLDFKGIKYSPKSKFLRYISLSVMFVNRLEEY